MDLKNKFLILKKLRYSESDLILHALSVEGTKFSFLAKGALRSKKRFGGGILEPLHHVELHYSSGDSSKLLALKEAHLINDFAGLRKDYDRLEFALRALDAVSRVSQEGDSSSQFLFNLLGHLLQTLSSLEDQSWKPLELQFGLKFLMQQGVLPIEPWMKPYLSLPITRFTELPLDEDLERRITQVDSHVKNYILNATVAG